MPLQSHTFMNNWNWIPSRLNIPGLRMPWIQSTRVYLCLCHCELLKASSRVWMQFRYLFNQSNWFLTFCWWCLCLFLCSGTCVILVLVLVALGSLCCLRSSACKCCRRKPQHNNDISQTPIYHQHTPKKNQDSVRRKYNGSIYSGSETRKLRPLPYCDETWSCVLCLVEQGTECICLQNLIFVIIYLLYIQKTVWLYICEWDCLQQMCAVNLSCFICIAITCCLFVLCHLFSSSSVSRLCQVMYWFCAIGIFHE